MEQILASYEDPCPECVALLQKAEQRGKEILSQATLDFKAANTNSVDNFLRFIELEETHSLKSLPAKNGSIRICVEKISVSRLMRLASDLKEIGEISELKVSG